MQSGDYCAKIASDNKLTLETFYDYNPGLDNPGCGNIQVGTNVCLDKPYGSNFPGPVPTAASQNGTSPNCSGLYVMKSGEDCNTISNKSNITLAAFEAANPSINDNCTNLVVGTAYCVKTMNNTGTAVTTAVSTVHSTASAESTNPL